ncbi:Uncharacterised protein [Escherichia coli]|uniref:Uncharacterized protein n=1 Tax=Escherichia coli TaxID=562 RepID=A0A376VVR8_ECOLX|nr:Uncharacterised protein [Escherichia coli]
MVEKHRLVLVAQLGRLTRRRYLTQYLTLSSSGMVVRNIAGSGWWTAVEPD